MSFVLAVLLTCGTAGSAFSEEAGEQPDLSATPVQEDVLIPDQIVDDSALDEAPVDQTAADYAQQTEEAEQFIEETEQEAGPIEPDAIQAETQPESYPQLTAEDIVRLDNGDAEILYDDEGRVTFIRGRYSPEKVENHEDAVESLNYVSNLLGLDKGALFFAVYEGIDYTTGYTNYLFLQRDGDVTILNASIKIYVDPDGYTAALSCSFDPAVGIREESAGSISAQDAEQIVRDNFPNALLTIYPNATGQAGIMEDGRNIHVWVVFSNNPDASTGGSDQPYLQHFVSYSGQYLMNLPCSTTNVPLLQEDDALERRAKAMFDGYEKQTWTGDVRLHDGSTIRLTVPVAKSLEDGRYYLMDLDRKMLVADYKEAYYGSGDFVISSSDTNSGWKDRELLAMYNIGRVYDYYADHGLYSVDGSGIPLAIMSGVCDADGRAIDNAYFNGFYEGFGIFAISNINDNVECLDIMGHEFTHGITSYSMGGSSYVNDLGAINEAYSDIMGNLCELTYSINDLSIRAGKTTGQFEITGTSPYGSTDDPNPTIPDWRIGEMGGKTYRDMSDPIRFWQPAFAGDAYYCLPTEHSNIANDYGGVHENSSLLGNIAWVLNRRGLNYEEQYSLWVTAMNMMTPKSDYDDILQALIFARKIYGWNEEIDTWLTEAFAERGLLENSHSFSGTWDGVTFRQYNAAKLKEIQQPQTEEPGTGETQNNGISDFLTGGAGTAVQSGTEESFPDLSDFLTGGSGAGGKSEAGNGSPGFLNLLTGDPSENVAHLSEILSDSSGDGDAAQGGSETAPGTDEGSGNDADTLAGMLSGTGKDWLEGVGLDSDGRIAREGFGRIEFDIPPEDRNIMVGATIIEPYTYKTISVNCPDEEGHVSFLLPEGIYWIALSVSYGGLTQSELWPYTTSGIWEKMGMFTVFADVEVKACQSVSLPLADVS